MCQAYTYVYPRPELAFCVSKFTAAQYNGFELLAQNGGYMTENNDGSYEYDLGGDPFTFETQSGLTLSFQNGTELYDFLWKETSYDVLATRDQYCRDKSGGSLTGGVQELVIP